jgi:hypothetical protein
MLTEEKRIGLRFGFNFVSSVLGNNGGLSTPCTGVYIRRCSSWFASTGTFSASVNEYQLGKQWEWHRKL